MKLLYLILVLNLSFLSSYGQKQFSITKAANLLSSKTWIMSPSTKGTSNVHDSHHYYIPQIDYPPTANSNSGFCIDGFEYILTNDPILSNSEKWLINKCTPHICVISKDKKNNHFIIKASSEEDGKEKTGKLVFVSENEFIIYPFSGKKQRFKLLDTGNVITNRNAR